MFASFMELREGSRNIAAYFNPANFKASRRRLAREPSGKSKYDPRLARRAEMPSRQRQRRALFTKEFADISHEYPGEQRNNRRILGRAIANVMWRESRLGAANR